MGITLKRVDRYECECCEATYRTEQEALCCELSHHTILEFIDKSFEPDDEFNEYLGYPKLILIADPTRSGYAAEYIFRRAGSIEDFDPYE